MGLFSAYVSFQLFHQKGTIMGADKPHFLDRVPLSSPQSRGEEIANSITHGIGVGISIAALVLLVVFAAPTSDPWRIVSFSIFGLCMTALYLSSTLYHSFRKKRVRQFFRILDHSSIFLLIAGSYTPLTLICLRGPLGWTIFGVIWAIAFAGITLKLFCMNKMKYVSLVLYILMGWLLIAAFKPMLLHVPLGMIVWLLIGGACYTFGVIFYVWKKLPYHHAVWHLFVLGGTLSHFFGMLFYLTK